MELDGNCADILQPDVTWCGGITEARKVIALAASRSKIVIPHGSSVYSYHLQFAFVNTPIAEFINLHPTGEAMAPYFGALFPDEPLPRDGRIYAEDLRHRPGFGVTLNKAGLCRPHVRTADAVAANALRNATLPCNAHRMPF